MNLAQVNSVYFLGIGGIGMSALARYFNAKGNHVSGYDKNPSPITDQLIAEGIPVYFNEDEERISNLRDSIEKKQTLVVYTPAIPKDHAELLFLQSNSLPAHKRSVVLGAITKTSKTIAVAGTHGKTTTSTIIAHILHDAGFGCNAFLGGIAANYQTNFLFSGPDAWNVVEADEYDRSFLTLEPTISVITSIDPDHLDVYGTVEEMKGTYVEFANLLPKSGSLYTATNVGDLGLDTLTYGFDDSDIKCTAVDYTAVKPTFDIALRGEVLEKMPLPLPGKHNIENTLVAVGIAHQLGIHESAIREALDSFMGIKRRFEYHYQSTSKVYIDDYAHHPAELAATIKAARDKHPGLKVTGIFQPHLFSRTRDFANEFAEELSKLDEIILLDIYPAREKPIPGVDSQWLLDKISTPHKKYIKKSQLLFELREREVEVLLTLGAGDIDRLISPIKDWISTT